MCVCMCVCVYVYVCMELRTQFSQGVFCSRYVSKPLKLGDLSGNRFTIVLRCVIYCACAMMRDTHTSHPSTADEAAKIYTAH